MPAPKTVIGDQDLHFFNEGTHRDLWRCFGAHRAGENGVEGTAFTVWAPNAKAVSVIGEFNDWTPGEHPLRAIADSGVWHGFVPGVERGAHYKYDIISKVGAHHGEKADPFGLWHEPPPKTSSVVWDLDYDWQDSDWMAARKKRDALGEPVSIYELHLGSWRRRPEEENRPLGYREMAEILPDYIEEMGFTHVELLPVMEHPFYGSWGYQVTGFFAPSARYGTPQDFMYLVDCLHQRGIGVILDWVPAHFPTDAHGLQFFDGTNLYEHADPRKGFHPDWQTSIFNYGRHEVRSFLLSSAGLWLDRYHADGLRVDAVASMLYLDYSRDEGGWVPNAHGGRENLEAISLLRQLNEAMYEAQPGIQIYAEESTSWPMVSRPTWLGGLGFGMKWDMGWMHDTLGYFSREPVHRKYHHRDLTFRGLYAFTENFVLPLSHDEVVHGKGSLLGKMPGDDWQRFANLRLLYGYMWACPGKKLLFMGGELAQWREWNHDESLDWHLLDEPAHAGMQRLVAHLNRIYRGEPALHQLDCEAAGFEWIVPNDSEQSVAVFERRGREGTRPVIAVMNFTPVPRFGYQVGVGQGGRWREIVNTDAVEYGGGGIGNLGGVQARARGAHGRSYCLELTLPPLGAVYLTPAGD